jgi:hypothetical protein
MIIFCHYFLNEFCVYNRLWMCTFLLANMPDSYRVVRSKGCIESNPTSKQYLRASDFFESINHRMNDFIVSENVQRGKFLGPLKPILPHLVISGLHGPNPCVLEV